MVEYKAKSDGSLTFVVSKDEELIGRLLYKSWFTFDAIIELADDSRFTIEPKGFWGTTIELKDGEKVQLKFKLNWNGDTVIQTHFDGFEKGYLFKHRGFFKESFVLIDQDGVELLVFKPELKWSKMNYEYHITASGSFESHPDKKMLLLSSLHSANYYMSMASGTF